MAAAGSPSSTWTSFFKFCCATTNPLQQRLYKLFSLIPIPRQSPNITTFALNCRYIIKATHATNKQKAKEKFQENGTRFVLLCRRLCPLTCIKATVLWEQIMQQTNDSVFTCRSLPTFLEVLLITIASDIITSVTIITEIFDNDCCYLYLPTTSLPYPWYASGSCQGL